jgi:hypothetical protein
LRHIVGSYAAVGVQNMLALRGDPPGDPGGAWTQHPAGLSYAADLVRLIRESGDFCVGVGAFPEGHTRAEGPEADLDFFVAKCRAGADFAVTQMFFFVEDYLRFRDAVTARGCDVPVIAGIMPIISVAGIDRSLLLSGCRFPAPLAEELHAHAADRAAVRKIGVEYAAGMCQQLLDEGAPGLHFFTLNGSRATGEIYEMLGLAEKGLPTSLSAGRFDEAHPPVQPARRGVAVRGRQHCRPLRAAAGQRREQGSAEASPLVRAEHVQFGDLKAVAEPVGRRGGTDAADQGVPHRVVPPLTAAAVKAVGEAHHRSGLAGPSLQRTEGRIAGVSPHEVAAARQEHWIGGHRVAVNRQRGLNLTEELPAGELAERGRRSHLAERTRLGAVVLA